MKNLNLIAEQDKRHFIQCEVCNAFFDCRDLSQVFSHVHDEINEPKFSYSGKVGEPIIYIKGKYELIQN